DFWCRNPSRGVELKLAMQAESGERIRAGDDGNSGIIKRLGHVQHALEGILVAPVQAVRDFQAAIEKTAPDLCRHVAGYGGTAAGHFSRPIVEHPFKNAERGVEIDFALLQQPNKRLDLV